MIVLWIFLSLSLLLSFFCYMLGFYSPVKGQNDCTKVPNIGGYSKYYDQMLVLIRRLEGHSFEAVTIKSKDNKTLYGRFYKNSDSSVVQLMLHGYRGCSDRDFCGGFDLALKTGYSILLVDQRACGKSQGHTVTMGVKESQDTKLWVDMIKQRLGEKTKILLYGVSMGSATAIMSLQYINSNIIGVIADCPYSSPKAIVKKVADSIGLKHQLSYPFALLGAFLYGFFDLNAKGAIDVVRSTDVPILFIHGTSDSFVPCYMSIDMYKEAKNPLSKLLLVDNAEHGLSYMEDNLRYERTVLEFLGSLGCEVSETCLGN